MTPDIEILMKQLVQELAQAEASLDFWKAQPSIQIGDGKGGMVDFRRQHLTNLANDCASIREAIDVLAKPHA